jgi:hypothetical protein
MRVVASRNTQAGSDCKAYRWDRIRGRCDAVWDEPSVRWLGRSLVNPTHPAPMPPPGKHVSSLGSCWLRQL